MKFKASFPSLGRPTCPLDSCAGAWWRFSTNPFRSEWDGCISVHVGRAGITTSTGLGITRSDVKRMHL